MMRALNLLPLLAIGTAVAQVWPDGQLYGNSFGIPGVNATYDYVVVGGGTAGLAISARLAQNPNVTVAVIEAGSFYQLDNGNQSQIPGLALAAAGRFDSLAGANSLVDWEFLSTPQPGFDNRTGHLIRGKCLGGCSAVNTMIFNRPTVGTMDQWAEQVGDASYSWNNTFPIFQKYVNFTGPNATVVPQIAALDHDDDSSFIASGGPLHVSYPRYVDGAAAYFPRAYEEAAIPAVPGNIHHGQLLGYGFPGITVDPTYATRSSSQTSYLQLALSTTPLVVYTRTMTEKLIFNANKTATGVLVRAAEMPFQINANREVILSAGAFQSPQLLMVSGIGPAATLQRFNIAVVADRPGVGQNMQDNPLVVIAFNDTTAAQAAADPYLNNFLYNKNRTGPLTNTGPDTIAFVDPSVRPSMNISTSTIAALRDTFASDWPQVQYMSGSFGGVGALTIGLETTFSRGNLTIASSSIYTHPIINPNWLSDPRDVELMVAGVKIGRQILAAPALASVNHGELAPGPAVQTDAEIAAYIHATSQIYYHVSCTCKMGKADDPMAVVDSKARVIGVQGLRVVDISAFPFLTPGQPQATVYMLAEKVAEGVLQGLADDNKARLETMGCGKEQQSDRHTAWLQHSTWSRPLPRPARSSPTLAP